jgi:hypothetical protein
MHEPQQLSPCVLYNQGSSPGRGWEFLSSPPRPDRLRAQPASYRVVPRDVLRGVKRPGREADHSQPSSIEVNNAWSYTSTSPYVFMAWYSVKHWDSFAFN